MADEIVEQASFFDEVVAEYKFTQKKVIKNFIYGCIELGEILIKYREKLKKEDKWLAFLEATDLNVAMVSQQIRVYEISKNKIEKDILASIITNWQKLNLFLPLTDEQKEQLLTKQLDENTSTADFRESVAEVKMGNTKIEIEDTKFEDEAWKKIEETSGANPMLVDTHKASKVIQNDLKVSSESRGIIEAILFIEKAKEILKSTLNLPTEEKEQMKELFGKQIAELEEQYTKFFS